jgi:phosphoribosylanthranilate isomerase
MIKVNVCGITTLEDALLASELGADALGFVMVPASKRYLDPAMVKTIIEKLPPFVVPVGVFADEKRGRITGLIERTGIHVAQLQGEEKPEDCLNLGCKVLKTFRVNDLFDISQMTNYLTDGFVLGSFSDLTYEETGKIFDWGIAVTAKKYGRIILSGGITPHNVLSALEQVVPYAVEVNTGVESMPGKKDKAKLADLIQKVKSFKG